MLLSQILHYNWVHLVVVTRVEVTGLGSACPSTRLMPLSLNPAPSPAPAPLSRPRHRPGHTEALEAEAGPEGLADEGERTADTGLRGEQLALANSGLFSLSRYYLNVW